MMHPLCQFPVTFNGLCVPIWRNGTQKSTLLILLLCTRLSKARSSRSEAGHIIQLCVFLQLSGILACYFCLIGSFSFILFPICSEHKLMRVMSSKSVFFTLTWCILLHPDMVSCWPDVNWQINHNLLLTPWRKNSRVKSFYRCCCCFVVVVVFTLLFFKCRFTSTETIRIVWDGSPGRSSWPLHSSWALIDNFHDGQDFILYAYSTK